jgi:uncharacterized membrane-anchored protein
MTEYVLTPGRNEVPEITAMRLDDGKGNLPKHSWPGWETLHYLDAHLNRLCWACASRNDEFTEPLIASDVNYEDPDLYCDHCGNQIKPEYGED